MGFREETYNEGRRLLVACLLVGAHFRASVYFAGIARIRDHWHSISPLSLFLSRLFPLRDVIFNKETLSQIWFSKGFFPIVLVNRFTFQARSLDFFFCWGGEG